MLIRKGRKSKAMSSGLLSLAVVSALTLAGAQNASANVLFQDGFESNPSGSGAYGVSPVGWTTIRNWSSDAESPVAPTTWQTTGLGAGHPFYGHGWSGDLSGAGSVFAAAPGNGSAGVIDLWLISPAIQFDGSAATVSFWTFSLSNSAASLEVRLSAGSGVVPNNGGDRDNGLETPLTGGVGDFTNLLLHINPDHQAGVYPTWDEDFNPAWTQYTVDIPAGLVSGEGYIAFRGYGPNVFSEPDRYRIVGVDDVVVTAVIPEPASLAGVALAGMVAGMRRRRI